MAALSEKAMLEKLKRFDTPSITNVVATYPGDPLCLGLMSRGGKTGIRPVCALYLPRAWADHRICGDVVYHCRIQIFTDCR